MVRQWFPFEASHSMDILRSYAQGVEAQVRVSLAQYEERREAWINDYNDLLETDPHPDEPDFEHAGLSGHVKDLADVFEDFFPSLQRSSALASIYSVFENQMNTLCDLVKDAIGSKLRFQDLNGTGVERARTYLIKVGGFDLTGLDGGRHWNNVVRIREVRNCFVHADGVLNDKTRKIIRAYANEVQSLQVLGDRVKLQEGFLEEVVTGCLRYCEVLAKAAGLIFPGRGSLFASS